MSRCLSAAIVLALALPSQAAELLQVKVKRDGSRYLVQSQSIYDATPQALFDVLLDYDNFEQISSVFKDSHYIEPADDGTPRAYTMVEGCVVFFCTQIERIDRLVVEPFRSIVAVSEPNPDDFKFSRSEWRFEQQDGRTLVRYELEMEPGFWVPPVVGPYLLKRRLVAGAVDAVDRVERIAQERTTER